MDYGLPKYLYKFRSWKDKHDKLILKERILYFPSPGRFNDPFDCSIPIRYDLMSESDFVDRLVSLAREQDPRRSTEDVRAEALRIRREMVSNPSMYKWFMRRQETLFHDNYGVLSLSMNRDNILQWSHYADCHQGFCVEFHARKLVDLFTELFKSDNTHIVRDFPVKYVTDYPEFVLSARLDEDDDVWDAVLTTKSDSWSYEQEYRFVYAGRCNLARAISRDIFSKVYLGCAMSSEDREEILDTLADSLPGIEVLQARKKDASFGLEYVPVEQQ